MAIRAWAPLFLGLLCFLSAAPRAQAQSCFHACFSAKKLPSDVTDQTLRETMHLCYESCQKAARTDLLNKGYASLLATCVPQAVSEAELKKVRSASPSVVAFANAFTWDVNNVLPDKIIRRVELTTQTMSLTDIVVSSNGYVKPGDTGTFYVGNVADGYPAVRVTTRIQAIYTCPVH